MTEHSQNTLFPVLPLRDIVVFPHMIVPLFVGREKSIHALEEVMKDDKQILLVAQKNASQDDPGRDDIYRVGTVSSVLQLLKLPDGTVKVLVEGNARARVTDFVDNARFFQVQAEVLPEAAADPREVEALGRAVVGQFELDQLLSEREVINQRLQHIIDEQTDAWGVKVSMVEVKHVDLPVEMQRAIARQAEAEREKRAKIIHAEGEFQAARQLVEAAKMMAAEPVTIQLRYLQTLTEIGAEKNTTIVFPLPVDMIAGLAKLAGRVETAGPAKS